jgi:hypothetical protein
VYSQVGKELLRFGESLPPAAAVTTTALASTTHVVIVIAVVTVIAVILLIVVVTVTVAITVIIATIVTSPGTRAWSRTHRLGSMALALERLRHFLAWCSGTSTSASTSASTSTCARSSSRITILLIVRLVQVPHVPKLHSAIVGTTGDEIAITRGLVSRASPWNPVTYEEPPRTQQ